MGKGCFWSVSACTAFFWEDIVSFFVIFLHLAYVAFLWANYLTEQSLMILALVAYFAYIVNAGQFLLKFKAQKLNQIWGIAMPKDAPQLGCAQALFSKSGVSMRFLWLNVNRLAS